MVFARLVAGLALAFALPATLQAQTARPPALRAASPSLAAKSFVRDDLASEAVRLEAALRTETREAAAKPAATWRRDGDAAAARADWRASLAAYASAVVTEPAESRNWLGYARAASGVEPKDYAERYRLRGRASAAAYAAYGRATTRGDEAVALDRLGAVFAAAESWRPALEAYRARLALADEAAARATYEDLREKHGFRVLGYKVDSDAAAPRVCFQFSELLAAKVDFAPFVAVSGSANAAVTNEGAQLCVDGLRHGQRYAFVLRQGLPSGVDESLVKAADYDVYVRDRAPQVRFTGRNYVLPRTGQAGIPVVSVNADRLAIAVARIGDRSLLPTLRSEDFLSQLSGPAARALASEKGTEVWKGSLATAKAGLNQDAVTAFPVIEAVGTLAPGLYVMTARPADGRPASADDDTEADGLATQWFVVSDLGLTAFSGPDGVHALVRSLSTAMPVAGVEVRLVARNNEILASRPTDGAGHAAFDPGLARGQGGTAPGLLVATLGDDYGFLDLATSAFDLADRGVKGRPATGGPEAYLYPERGVYRSGETAFVTALLRDARGVAMPGLPLTLVVRRPDGVEYRRAQVADEGLGGRAFAIPLLAGAARGTWRVAAYLDPRGTPLGETAFLVEDYVPERLDVVLSAAGGGPLRQGQAAEIAVAARFLYGAPGADLDVAGNVVVEPAPASAIPGLDRFTVGLDDETVEPASAELEERGRTDREGRATVTVPLPALSATRPLQARIALQVGEDGGRAVSRTITLPILPDGPVLAVRETSGGALKEGSPASFEIVAARPDGTRLAPAGIAWTLSKVEKRYQWYRQDGRWSFEPVRSTRKVADGTVDLAADAPARVTAPVGYGTYRMEVRGPGLATASATVTVGWSGDETADVPDLLDVTLDKAAYASGERLRARLQPRFAGKATVAVVSDRVQDLQVVDLPAEGATVEIPVKPEWGAGAYLVATAYRPLDVAAKRLPGRAMGVAWFSVDRAARTLDVSLGAPAQMRPRGTLSVPVRLAGLAPGEDARITLAAVDVGILNLTRYVPPEPFGFFFGQKSLSTELRDLYGYLIDGMQGTVGAIRSGGDAGGGELADSPPTQAPLARYSGVVRVGPDGTAAVDVDIPAFNGTARLMAVAWTTTKVGSASADVVVRDPVVLTGTLPRFLSVGDRSRFAISLDNVEAAGGDFVVDLDLAGPMVVPAEATHRTVRLDRSARTTLAIPLAAAGPGVARVEVRLTGPGIDGVAGQSFAVPVQPGSDATVRRTVRSLEPGGSLSLTSDLVADILPGTGTVALTASPLAALDVPALLAALDRYPYGCTEQVVSRALPLLYANRLATLDRLGVDGTLDERVRGSIDRVLARQGADGSFGLWGTGGEDLWLDAYVTDFLTRAREAGFAVPPLATTLALDRLRNTVANTTAIDRNGAEVAYAAYVLARNGRPVMGDLRYLADSRLKDFTSALSRGQIAAALALLGDRTRARTAFASALERLGAERDGPEYRPDYGSRLRDGAGLLALAGEADLAPDAIRPIGAVLTQERAGGRPTSTQEQAWMVMAAQSLAKEADALSFSLDGVPVRGALYRTIRASALDGTPVTLANTGRAPAQIVVSVSGSPVGPEPAEARGFAVERNAYRLDGTPVDLARVRQNDRIAIVLKVTETQARGGRLMLVDRLPAGFEIDNPKLADADAFTALPMLKSDVQPAHTEFRDDRFVATYDRDPGQPALFSVGYVVRAVSPGTYVQPAATIEDMYRPERFGRTAFGQVEIVPARP